MSRRAGGNEFGGEQKVSDGPIDTPSHPRASAATLVTAVVVVAPSTVGIAPAQAATRGPARVVVIG
ncbi:hypothetical protein EF294_11495 [Gordonia oryzae]|uniref:Uncharacterized protein n=1 Tax=Gordonia oryzae TaxID=2487349 RepID=A0A3N4GGU8_9ACTN|nr:hypothetical protein [Gordonia oryzae]RPA59876.1 hypothetical protein EF294_11495 [Gordonia oryzae]